MRPYFTDAVADESNTFPAGIQLQVRAEFYLILKLW